MVMDGTDGNKGKGGLGVVEDPIKDVVVGKKGAWGGGGGEKKGRG